MYVRLIVWGAVAVVVVAAAVLWYTGAWRTPVTLWLISRVEPYQRVIPDAPQILVVGDSTAYGTGAARSRDSVAGRLAAAHPGYTVQTRAINGLTTTGALDHLDDWLGARDYALILVQLGANDVIGGVAPETTEANMQTILGRLTEQSEAVVWMSSGNVGAAPAFHGARAHTLTERAEVFRAMAARVAAETGVTYVDLFDKPADDPFVQAPSTYVAADGLHPSSAGYALWFERSAPAFTAALAN